MSTCFENQKLNAVWVSTIDPSVTMDAATWIDTTRELRRLGWNVTLICTGPDGQYEFRGVEYTAISVPQVYFMGKVLFHLRIALLLMRQWSDVDVVLFHQISALWLLPLRLYRWVKGTKRPLFIMDTRDIPDPAEGSWRVWLHRQFYVFAHWVSNRWADGQITITKKMAENVHVPENRLFGTWPSGVDLDSFAAAHKCRQWPAADEPVHLIYIGSLGLKRRLLPLCHAVEQANKAGMSFVFSMVGDGDYKPTLAAFAEKTDGCVRVLPPVPHDQVYQFLAKAHVGVTPLPEKDDQKYMGSSPLKMFEYMAAGLPILSTTNPCHTEVVGEGKFAFWADGPDADSLHQALSQLWQQRESLPSLSPEALAAANDWTWEAAAKKLNNALCVGLAANGEKTS